jgi:hypothetical protein
MTIDSVRFGLIRWFCVFDIVSDPDSKRVETAN